MIILGVLLLVLVVAIVAFVLVTGSSDTVPLTWDALNIQWNPTPALLFAVGALTLAVLALSLLLMRAGVRRRVHSGQEMRRLRKLERETGGRPTVPGRHTDGRDDAFVDETGAPTAKTHRRDATGPSRPVSDHRSDDDWGSSGPEATHPRPSDPGASPADHDGR